MRTSTERRNSYTTTNNLIADNFLDMQLEARNLNTLLQLTFIIQLVILFLI